VAQKYLFIAVSRAKISCVYRPLPGKELFEANVALEVAEKDVGVLDVHP